MTSEDQVTLELVLWAVMSEKTPLGAILDRLTTNLGRELTRLEKDAVIVHINTLNNLQLVIISYTKGKHTELYQKIPFAKEKLEQHQRNKISELLYDPMPRRPLELPPLAESPFPKHGTGRWPSDS